MAEKCITDTAENFFSINQSIHQSFISSINITSLYLPSNIYRGGDAVGESFGPASGRLGVRIPADRPTCKSLKRQLNC